MKKSTVSKKDLATKIIDFITNANSHTLTTQLWRLPENGCYEEIEINKPIVNIDNETISINDIDDTLQALNIDLSNVACIDYSLKKCFITLKNGEALKLVCGTC